MELNAVIQRVNFYNADNGYSVVLVSLNKNQYTLLKKSGNLIGIKAVSNDDEVMLITTGGIIIRIKVSDTALLGRVTSGVKLINLDKGVTVAQIAKVREKVSDGDQEIENIDDISDEIEGDDLTSVDFMDDEDIVKEYVEDTSEEDVEETTEE